MAKFHDRTLTCKDCGQAFTFTSGEQLFFHEKNFTNEPKRCKECKAKRIGGVSQTKTETVVNCSGCSKATTVPFRPTQGRPVFCRECFQDRKTLAADLTPSFEAPARSARRPPLRQPSANREADGNVLAPNPVADRNSVGWRDRPILRERS